RPSPTPPLPDRPRTCDYGAGASGTAAEVADPGGWPLIGREAELAALTGLLGPADGGRAGFAAVTGEPGIGKSRLVAELATAAAGRGFAVLAGRCSEDTGAPPFWPWSGVLRDLAAVLGDDTVRDLADADVLAGLLPRTAAPVAAPVAAPPPDAGSPDAQRFRVSDAVTRVLAAASVRRPLLVVLDDLHWADASSLRLLRHLAEHLVTARVLVVVTRRTHPEPSGVLAEAGAALARRHALRLDLPGLSAAGVTELVRAVTGAAPATQHAEALRERTDGNPFFLVELLRLPAGGDIPAAVTDVVARRVDRLPDPARDLLRSAAVLGRRFDADLLAAVAGADPDAVLDDLDPALAAGVILEESEPGRFRFAHALVHDVVYRAQPATRRARRHAAAAAAVSGGG
ncbi:AAA family ATPase, partial [Dactylosporangium sp. NPDC005572]|uniref:ATP-binding protein n=1 Tax=Dactylosporangium sp. NPDC005572 TaxID=3156889 RepID=UPI00339E955F